VISEWFADPKTQTKNQMTTTTKNYIPKYEILDSMECVVATADCFNDAIYASEKYAPSMIWSNAKEKVVFVQH
jgi:hypothetical protein